ncbi:MAG: DUF1993 domain-containing protein [Burkholderiales bacterium]|nr:DUF1993 domain-containing protein [Burkholderiales bacterium]
MYAASVPVCQRYLGQLAHMLNLAEAHAARQALDVPNLLQARLAPDMLPLALQVDIAAHFALRACAPLAGLDVPDFGEDSHSFEQLQTRIRHNQAFLDTLTPELMEDGAQRSCSSQAGKALVTLPGDTFLSQYALPNFFFHLSCTYAILRQQGVPLGKADFDGWHLY